MADVTCFDSRLRVEKTVSRDGMTFYDIEQKPFAVHGVMREGDRFRRMPSAVSSQVSPAVAWLSDNTAGGRVRFTTDSDVIAVEAELCAVGKMPHFALTGSVGFDVYADEGEGGRYVGSLIPPFDVEDRFEAKVMLSGRCPREITVNFPLYSGVRSLYIGVRDDAGIGEAVPYNEPLPVVFYGSSITQGGCASRPGNSYQAILSRRLGFDYINLGFSGSALAEPAMIDYLASVPMRVFVMDYDHNAPDTAHLRNTHRVLYQTVREAQPTVPVVMMSRPKYRLDEEELERLAVVRDTFEYAKAAGDTRAWFIDGRELVGEEFAEIATVDGAHPNDAGFYAMAKRLEKTLKEIL